MNTVVKSLSVTTLWKQLEEGCFAVPEIQREFVWNMEKVCTLFDSIYRQLPIGSILLWETDAKNRYYLRHKTKLLPNYNEENDVIWFILDGQQRLSALYRARQGGEVTNSKRRKVDFDHLYFNTDKTVPRSFVYSLRPNFKSQFPLKEILKTRLQSKYIKLPIYQKEAIEKCRNRIMNYRIPVISMKTLSRDEVSDAFIRINSCGMRVKDADKVFADATEIKLGTLVKQLREELTHRKFDDIPEQTICLAVSLMDGGRDPSPKAVSKKINEWKNKFVKDGKPTPAFNKNWGQIKESIKKAVDYLDDKFGVVDYEMLPSANMVATIAFFFYTNNGTQPNAFQKKWIKNWFWSTAVGSRYSGRGYNSNIGKDVESFKKLAEGEKPRFHNDEKVSISMLKHVQYNGNSSLGKAFMCLLCRNNPCYFENGEPIRKSDYAAIANRKDKHHIFSRALLNRAKISEKEINSICNICLFAAQENQSFGRKLPIEYLQKYRGMPHFKKVMDSHLIPTDKKCLWSYDLTKSYKPFKEWRLKRICSAFMKEAGNADLFTPD